MILAVFYVIIIKSNVFCAFKFIKSTKRYTKGILMPNEKNKTNEASTDKKDKSNKSDKNSKKNTTKEQKSKKTETKAKPKKDSKNTTETKKKIPSIKELSGMLFAKMMRGGASELRANAEEVNRLNVFPVPDGDTGDNMSMTIESGVAALESVESDNIAEAMRAASRGMLLGARGNSGVILSQFFAGIAKGFENSDEADAVTLGKALELGVEQAYASVMTPTEGTILTVAREAVEYAVSRIGDKSTIQSVFSDLVREMRRSLKRTPEHMAILKDAGVVDSGGAGLYYIMDGLNRALNGEELDDVSDIPAAKAPVISSDFGPDSVMLYGYCTELIVQLQRSKCDIDAFDVEEIKPILSELGDSIVIFKTESILKLHIHTMTPEKVLKLCRKYGEFINVKIENMTLQHTSITPTKEYAVIAVSSGDGISEVFQALGVNVIIKGGQSCNPSTQDFIEAFDEAAAKHIYVFPNNSNIFMAATQAAEIYKKSEVHIIECRSMGSCYAALSSISFEESSVEEILSSAKEAIEHSVSAHICPAIRDTEMNGLTISDGDTIGFIGKELLICDSERVGAAKAIIDLLLSGGERFAMTVFTGKDSTEEEQEELGEYVKATYPDCEVFFTVGGQEIYSYIFVAE